MEKEETKLSTDSQKEDVFACDHSDVCFDKMICSICGKDMLEAAKADAFDRWKDKQKYGDE